MCCLLKDLSQRIIDHVPTTIQHDFVQGFADTLQDFLLRQLEADEKDATQRFEKWLEENPNVARARSRLQERLDRLNSIRSRLENY